MLDKALNILEYNKIIELLASQTSNSMACQIVKSISPSTDIDEIRDSLRSTTEGVDLIVHKGPLPLGKIYDIEGSVHLAYKGRTLTMKELLHINYNMRVARQVVSFLKSDVPELPIIMAMAEVIETMPRLEEKIDRCILSEDEMSDNASPELKSIRRGIIRQNEAIKNRLNNILNSQDNKTVLQDAIVTMRDGRYVVPIKQEHRGRFPGIVHDQSQSGATLFIEPQVVVNLNNELRELELKERAEIERILLELSGNVAEYHHQLLNNQKLLVELDVIMAKGKLSCQMGGEEPTLNNDGILQLRDARHPLIASKKVVPINVQVGEEYRTLVVTGPNTGGKTVTLKTVGLLALMVQSGLHIPAASTSKMPVFTDIFADIGDEQSIEQSLSTFSSHMKNIVEIVRHTNESSLVLLDELGAGTDPTEGAALAIAILERIYDRGAMTIATTHYTELKKYAISTEGVENASMEFDVESLSPTYRLVIGIPGKSNAFEISKKLGLKPDIIDRARSLIEGKDIEFEEVLSAIEKDKKKAEAERDEARRIILEIQRQKDDIQHREDALKKKEKEIISDAKEAARNMLREAELTAKEVQKELKELSKIESLGQRNKTFDKNRRRLKENADKYQEMVIREVNNNPVKADTLRIGDRVKIMTLNQNGEILSLPDSKGDLQVLVGVMKASVNIEDLVLINDGTKGKRSQKTTSKYGSLYKQKAQNVSISINVQGENLEEAEMDVDKYLDDAFMAGLKEVTIIHGRGEGVLKNGIRQLLKKHKHVDSFRKGNYNEGGDGVTIVKFKS